MKKITLTALIVFALVVLYLFAFQRPPSQVARVVMDIQPPILDTTVAQAPASQPPAGSSGLTAAAVAQHNTPDDCYLIINNNVYDVSSYISFHPGGRRAITSRCGQEVTGIFASIHSNRAWDLLARYKIGAVATAEASAPVSVSIDLNTIEAGLAKANPDAEIVSVKPKHDFYIAKVILNNKLYEVHINAGGTIISEEVESDEFDWSAWDTDTDDQ